jgi:uncharacterized Zn finger protein
MEIKCPNCLKIFNPNEKDEKFILEAIKKNQKLAFIECQECYKDVPVNPLNLLEIENKPEDKIMDCPICKDGIIVHIKNETEDFYGCGECGNVWKNITDIK